MDLIIPEGINRGDTPRVPKAPRGVPSVDPDTRGQENPTSLTKDKSIVIILSMLTIHPKGWPLLYEASQIPKVCFANTEK